MEQQTFEGTWEEILLHAPELVGRRVKLTVVDKEASKPETANTLGKTLQGKVGRVRFQPFNLSEQTGAAFADLMVAKHTPSDLSQ